jgi:hypothetical protein
MQLRKVKHIFIFFILFDGIVLFISTVLRQKIVILSAWASKYKTNQPKDKINSNYYVVNKVESIEKWKTQLQLTATGPTSIANTATNHSNNFTDYPHQLQQAYKQLPKLMLFPYHSFW